MKNANRTQGKNKKSKDPIVGNFASVNNSVIVPSSKNHTSGGHNDSTRLIADQIFKHNISQQMNQMDHQQSMELNKILASGGQDLHELQDLNEFEQVQQQQNLSQMQYEKKRKGRSSALRNRPKSSMLEHHRDSVNKS